MCKCPDPQWIVHMGKIAESLFIGTGVIMALAAVHFHGFGVARQGPWITWVNSLLVGALGFSEWHHASVR